MKHFIDPAACPDDTSLDLAADALENAAHEARERAKEARRARMLKESQTAQIHGWTDAVSRTKDMIAGGLLPDHAAKIARDTFSPQSDDKAILHAATAATARQGRDMQFRRDWLIFQMFKCGLSNRQIAASLDNAVSVATVNRAIHRFV